MIEKDRHLTPRVPWSARSATGAPRVKWTMSSTCCVSVNTSRNVVSPPHFLLGDVTSDSLADFADLKVCKLYAGALACRRPQQQCSCAGKIKRQSALMHLQPSTYFQGFGEQHETIRDPAACLSPAVVVAHRRFSHGSYAHALKPNGGMWVPLWGGSKDRMFV